MKNRIQGIVIGFVIGVMLTGTMALADSVVPGTTANINVRYSTIKTIINGKEFKPEGDDMIPFSYNDRTFVSLKFIAEAFGKDIYWDRDTDSAIINDPVPFTNVFSDPLTGPLSSDWSRGSGTVNIDPINGCYLADSGGILQLDTYSKRNAQNYTVEFDLAIGRSNTDMQCVTVGIGRTKDGKQSDYVSFRENALWINKNPTWNTRNNNKYPAGIELKKNEYSRVKIDVGNGMMHIYIDGTLITSDKYLGDEMDISFSTIAYSFCYIRNFKLTVNE